LGALPQRQSDCTELISEHHRSTTATADLSFRVRAPSRSALDSTQPPWGSRRRRESSQRSRGSSTRSRRCERASGGGGGKGGGAPACLTHSACCTQATQEEGGGEEEGQGQGGPPSVSAKALGRRSWSLAAMHACCCCSHGSLLTSSHAPSQREDLCGNVLQVQHAARPAVPRAGGHQLHKLFDQEQGAQQGNGGREGGQGAGESLVATLGG
jgi:hypothetical protein